MMLEKSHSVFIFADFRKSMKPSIGWSSRQEDSGGRGRRKWGLSLLRAWTGGAFVACFLAAGCAHDGQHRSLVGKRLQVGCPDVLTIEVAGQPAFKVTNLAVGPDGRLDLGKHGKPRVEGCTPAQIAALVAPELDVPVDAVHVQIVEYRSQQLFLFGQIVGWQRSVPYNGQESVLDLLKRVGGIMPGAEPGEVYVVRSHIAEGGRPEVFHVDLQAIVERHDQKTNLRVMPNDQIYVGETRQARMERAIPPWMRPLYQSVWNTKSPAQ